jgi:hypothetical protein
MRANDPSFIRLTVLTGMVASLALMSAKVLLYRPLLAIPGGRGNVLGTAGLLVLYGFLVQQSHLTIGPIAGAIFAAIGGVITRLNDKQEQRPAI